MALKPRLCIQIEVFKPIQCDLGASPARRTYPDNRLCIKLRGYPSLLKLLPRKDDIGRQPISTPVILLDWSLIGAPSWTEACTGAGLSILIGGWGGFEPLELLELQTLYPIKMRIGRLVVSAARLSNRRERQ